ncbi:hypothetical protein EVAR_57766_1 [Eumeta japonica]|uniref:Uncharacterized protein n=1 Tax=Eumeta variegata TaxID=151549 RepID=A0A4C1Y8U5_EUMVA|nr:hypothetical protein EVAR_57766_1 [Eumeta japonica]
MLRIDIVKELHSYNIRRSASGPTPPSPPRTRPARRAPLHGRAVPRRPEAHAIIERCQLEVVHVRASMGHRVQRGGARARGRRVVVAKDAESAAARGECPRTRGGGVSAPRAAGCAVRVSAARAITRPRSVLVPHSVQMLVSPWRCPWWSWAPRCWRRRRAPTVGAARMRPAGACLRGGRVRQRAGVGLFIASFVGRAATSTPPNLQTRAAPRAAPPARTRRYLLNYTDFLHSKSFAGRAVAAVAGRGATRGTDEYSQMTY